MIMDRMIFPFSRPMNYFIHNYFVGLTRLGCRFAALCSLNHSLRSLFLAGIIASQTTTSLYAAPKIECDAPRYDFGTVVGRESITNRFIVRNAGDEPLVVSQIKNCCGVESVVEPMTIPPGSNAVCTSVFNTKNRYGAQDKQILLITNDKKNLYYDLRMTGTLLKPIEVEPRFIRLGAILPDGVVSETIVATNLMDEAVVLESVSTTVKGLVVEVVEDDDCRAGTVENLPAAEAGGGGTRSDAGTAGRSATVPALQNNDSNRCWTVRVRSVGVMAVGKMSGQVRLHFSTGAVDVPVIGEVKPILQATPDRIRLSSDSSKEVERLVMLRSGDGRDFEVVSAKLENADGEVEARKLADGKWRITLTVQPATIKPGASIVVATSVASHATLSIPLLRQ